MSDGDPLSLQTNKAVDHLLGNAVWFVQGDGVRDKDYSLGSIFIVSETGNTGREEFQRFARGSGHVFEPVVRLNVLDWFTEFFRAMAHFSLGVHELKDERLIAALRQVSSESGYAVSE
ncbi:MAG TPA: hypothetical protein VFI31_28345 [Pirellulales bacterium]|nr:hypothetical protein [Pirellulales bacterium]